jgi:hypothetical protein
MKFLMDAIFEQNINSAKHWEEIPISTDLNTVVTPGFYRIVAGGTAHSSQPYATSAGTLLIVSTSNGIPPSNISQMALNGYFVYTRLATYAGFYMWGNWSDCANTPLDITPLSTNSNMMSGHSHSFAKTHRHLLTIEEDFLAHGITTQARGINLPLATGVAGSVLGTLVDWNIYYAQNPGVIAMKAPGGTSGMTKGIWASSFQPTIPFGQSLYTLSSEKLTVIFRLETSNQVYIGRYIPDGTITMPSVGHIVHINTSRVLRGRINSTDTSTSSSALSLSTWYRIEMEVNSARSSVTFTLYSAAGTVLWTNSVNTTITNNAIPIFAAQSWHTGTGAVDLCCFDYVKYELLRTLTR